MFWAFVPFSLYSFVGNLAPFFEVGVGAYLDGRTRAHWLIPLLIFVFLYNIRARYGKDVEAFSKSVKMT